MSCVYMLMRARSSNIATINPCCRWSTPMRASKRRRPMRREQAEPPPHVDLTEIAGRASYIGSPEHKDRPYFGGQPMPRSDATICPPHLDSPNQLTTWLRSAIRAGHVGAPWEGDFHGTSGTRTRTTFGTRRDSATESSASTRDIPCESPRHRHLGAIDERESAHEQR